MKPYVAATGVVFGLLALAHVWRVLIEGVGVARNPWFLLTTALAAGLCGWAIVLLRARPGR